MERNADAVMSAIMLVARIIADVASGEVTEALEHVEEAVRAANAVGCATDAEVRASERCVDVAVLRRIQECLNSKLPNPVGPRKKRF